MSIGFFANTFTRKTPKSVTINEGLGYVFTNVSIHSEQPISCLKYLMALNNIKNYLPKF